jgi:hypothetical protein
LIRNKVGNFQRPPPGNFTAPLTGGEIQRHDAGPAVFQRPKLALPHFWCNLIFELMLHSGGRAGDRASRGHTSAACTA